MADQLKPSDQNIIVKPLETKEPPPEVLKINFEMDSDLLENNTPPPTVVDEKVVQTEDEKKATEAAKKTAEEKAKITKPEEKPEEKPAEEKTTLPKFLKPPKSAAAEVAKPVVKPEDKSGTKIHRDYTGYSNEEVEMFKQMSDKAYDFVTKKLKENKELATKASSAPSKELTIYQHPNAYLLSQEYQNLQTQTNMAQFEAKHYEKALLDLKAGKAIRVVEGYDKQGSPIFSDEIAPSDELEESLRRAVNTCYRRYEENNKQLTEIPTQFNSRINADLQGIQAERQKRFVWVANPDLENYMINVEGNDTSIKDIKQTFKSIWPDYWRNNPAVDVAADLMVAMHYQAAELAELKASLNAKQVIQSEEKLVEPTSKAQPSAESEDKTFKGKKNVPKTFSREGMPE